MTQPALIFDVNETLLDLSPVRDVFESIFGAPDAAGEWFARLLHGSLVANLLDSYRPFGTIALDALRVVGVRKGIDVSGAEAAGLIDVMTSLPPHRDVPDGLAKLADRGLRMVTLTNSSLDAAETQLTNAGIRHYFEEVMSVEAVRKFKPAPEPYRFALDRIGVEAGGALMIASHDWDIAGARRVGLDGAYLERPGAIWGLPEPKPDLVTSNLSELADRLAQDPV